jgi:hypothetical protein
MNSKTAGMTVTENKNRTLGEFLWGIALKAKQPAPEPKRRDPPGLPSRAPLLRYPQGEAAVDRGVGHVWR